MSLCHTDSEFRSVCLLLPVCDFVWVLLFRSDTILNVAAEVVVLAEDSTVEDMVGLEDKYALFN